MEREGAGIISSNQQFLRSNPNPNPPSFHKQLPVIHGTENIVAVLSYSTSHRPAYFTT